MGLKRVTKKFLKYFIPVLLVSLIIPFTGRVSRHSSANPFPSNDIRCQIFIGEAGRSSKDYLAGYHYETLCSFASAIGDTARVTISESGDSSISLILRDSLDIAVVPSCSFVAREGLYSANVVDTTMLWVMKDLPGIKAEFAHWLIGFIGSPAQTSSLERFFIDNQSRSRISPYDEVFQKHSHITGWDWRLLAALTWTESKFRIEDVSHRGAVGLMQMMPRTASQFAVEDYLDPDQSIKAGCEVLKAFRNLFVDVAANDEELIKFTLAAYNAGGGRILECVNYAQKSGVDPSFWENLDGFIKEMGDLPVPADSLDSRPRPFKGEETRAYVKTVLNKYDRLRGLEPRYPEMDDSLLLEGLDSLDLFSSPESADSLLSPDSLRRVDLGDEHARYEEKKQDDDKGDDISGKDPR